MANKDIIMNKRIKLILIYLNTISLVFAFLWMYNSRFEYHPIIVFIGFVIALITLIFIKGKSKNFIDIDNIIDDEINNEIDINRKETPELLTLIKPPPTSFLGRENNLQELIDLLKGRDTIITVNGLAGVGKTTLVSYIVNYLIDRKIEAIKIKHIAWITVIKTLGDSILDYTLISNLHLHSEFETLPPKQKTNEEKIKILINKLANLKPEEGKSNVLIIDNATQKDRKILKQLECLHVCNWKIIVISRERIGEYKKYEIDLLKKEDAINLFIEHYKLRNDEKLIDEIIDSIGRHTLTIEILAKTANKHNWTLLELKSKMVKNGFAVTKMSGILTSHSGDLSIDDINAYFNKILDLSGLDFDMKMILTQFSIFPTQPALSLDLIKRIFGRDNSEVETDKIVDIFMNLKDKGWLQCFSENEELYFFMHPVISQITRNQLNPDIGKCGFLIDSLIKEMCVLNDPEEILLFKAKLLPYALSVSDFFRDNETEQIAILCDNISSIYQYLCKSDNALQYQEKAIKIKEKILLPNSISLATSYNNLSLIFQARGEFIKAMKYQEIALKMREEKLPELDPALAQSYNIISTIYLDLEEFNKAKHYQDKSIEIRKKVLGHNHIDLAISYNNLSNIYYCLGDVAKAKLYQVKSIEIYKKVLPAYHRDLAKSFNYLSLINRNLGHLDKAIQNQEIAIEIWKNILPISFIDLAISYNNLSMIYQDKGNYYLAKSYQEKVTEMYLKELPDDHPDLATSYNNLSTIFHALGKIDQAKEYQQKAIEIYEKILPSDHFDLALSYNNLSIIYKDLGEIKIAKDYQEKALKIYEKILNPFDPSLASCYNNISVIYMSILDFNNAKYYQEKAIKIKEKVLPIGHPDLASSYNNLASIYFELGEYPEAMNLINNVIKILEDKFPEGHPNLKTAKKWKYKIKNAIEK